MSGFLQKIHDLTRTRVAAAKKLCPVSTLEQSPHFNRRPADVMTAFRSDTPHIIAEVKFASPSEGDIRTNPQPIEIAQGYLAADARMLSILTEPSYFKGDLDYLHAVRTAAPEALLLRKDFMIDPYQMYEARAHGADAILLIVAMTDPALTRDLFQAAAALSLTALVEVHDAAELDAAIDLGATMIGVNNRNLKTLKTDLDTSRTLARQKPKDAIFICESGLTNARDVQEMRSLGYDGFLMGTHFMRQPDPGAALAALMRELS